MFSVCLFICLFVCLFFAVRPVFLKKYYGWKAPFIQNKLYQQQEVQDFHGVTLQLLKVIDETLPKIFHLFRILVPS